MQIAILGPLEVRDDAGTVVEIAGARVRTLLITLALDAGRSVAVNSLVDVIWGDQPPADAQNALQTLVSRVRRVLGGPAAISASAAGYRLAITRDDVDVHRFEQLVVEAADLLRAGRLADVADRVDAAVALWRGPALADVVDQSPTLAARAARLDDALQAALRDRTEAHLLAGEAQRVVAELEDRAWQRPLDEHVTGQLMRALADVGRQADALAAYERVRERLSDELGVDPSTALKEIHLAVLRGEYGAAPGPSTVVQEEPPEVRRTNLRAQLTSFVGREDEVARIGKSLEQNRLVTLVGPGGAGKTRLAGESAATVADAVSDGVWLVELAPVSSGADIVNAVLNSVGLREMNLRERHKTLSARDAHALLIDGLCDKQMLIVLDNCEHLIEASATLVDQLLGACPGLRVMATSREPLGIVGEALLAVPPLGQPEPTTPAAQAMEYPAVRLFADRAAAVAPDFELDDTGVESVIEIVRRLDGLPLAIELAAARVRTTPLPDIATRLSDRFRLLTGGSRTALPRHRTLRAVVEWSWDLLSDDERALIEQLAVFAGGITAASAASTTGMDPDDVADLLSSLADKSLLQPVEAGRRMRMLETIREYGTERLAERDALSEARGRHARHFAGVVTEAEPLLLGPGQLPWFALLTAERENILVAMRYLGDTGDADAALHVAVTLGLHAMMLGAYTEIAGWIAEALDVPGGHDSDLRLIAQSLHTLNTASNVGPTPREGDDVTRPSLRDLARKLAEVPIDYSPLVPLLRGVVAFFAGEQEYLARFSQHDLDTLPPWTRASLLLLRASMAENDGDVATLRVEATAAYEQFRGVGERWGMSGSLRMLAQVYLFDGDLDAAERAMLEAMKLSEELGSQDDLTFVRTRLADISIRRGDFDAARRHVEEARRYSENHGDHMEIVYANTVLSTIEYAAGNRDTAREMQRSALAHVDDLPPGHPVSSHFRAFVHAITVRVLIDDGEVAAARNSARLGYESAVETKDGPMIASVGVAIAYLDSLTGRPENAAGVLGASARMRGADDATAWEIEQLRNALVESLGEAEFDRLYEAGKALDRDAAVERLAPMAD